MLTFLRKIRRSLIESGSTQKYLLYAIGEIALVVIGILIALQINNWNESKKIYRIDQEFLQNLKNELIQDTISFHSRKISYSEINQMLTESIRLLSETIPLSNEQIEIVKRSVGALEILTPLYKNININNQEIANGRLDRINPELNNKYTRYIESYQSDFEVSSKFGESLQAMSIKYIFPLVQYGHGFNRNADLNINDIQGNTKFINVFHRSIGWRRVNLNRLQLRIENVEELLTLIEKHLEMIESD